MFVSETKKQAKQQKIKKNTAEAPAITTFLAPCFKNKLSQERAKIPTSTGRCFAPSLP